MAVEEKKRESRKDLLVKAIKRATEEWKEEVLETSSKMSAKGKEASELLATLSVGKTDKQALAKLASLMIGEPVELQNDEDLEFHPLVSVVLTGGGEDAKHGYETGTPVVCTGDGTAIGKDGKPGGFIPKKRAIIRVATDKEIDDMPEAQIKGLMKIAMFV